MRKFYAYPFVRLKRWLQSNLKKGYSGMDVSEREGLSYEPTTYPNESALTLQLGRYATCTTRILWGGLWLCTIGLFACKNDTLDNPTLSVSPNEELVLPSNEAQATLSISTNQARWSAVSSSPWLKLRQAGNNLIVEAENNPLTEERLAQIVVVSGNKQQQITVRQQIDRLHAIALEPTGELSVDRLSQEYRIVVKTSSNQWRASVIGGADSWLEVLARPRYGEIILSFKENKTRATRSAQLIVQDGEVRSELLIHQQGIPHFFLPYLAWESDLEDAEAFEQARNSRLTLRPRTADPVQGVRAIPYFQFSTISSAFQQVRYEYLNMSPRFLYKATLVAQDLNVTKGTDLTDFLQQEGYVLRSDLQSNEDNKFYLNEPKKIALQYTMDKSAREAYLIFTPLVEQTEAYAVPDKLPLGFPLQKGSTKSEVETWEKQMKSEVAEGISQALGLPSFFALDPHFLRYYLYQENDANLLQATFFTLDPKYQGLYRYGGLFFMGREFDALIKSEGFVYDSYDQRGGIHYYTHEQRNLRLAISLMRIANLELTRGQVTLLK